MKRVNRVGLAVLALSFFVHRPAPAQSGSTLREVVAALSGPVMIFVSDRLPEPVIPTCGPCPRSEVNPFDRWVIHEELLAPQVVGWATIGGLMAYTWSDMARDDAAGFSHIRASAEASLFAGGLASLLKETFHRRRPAWYTNNAVGQSVATMRENMRSFPSGDTSIGFALATSYVLSRGPRLKPFQKVLVFSGASLVGVARLAGGKHFPTDVLGGAAVGMFSAWAVHEIRF